MNKNFNIFAQLAEELDEYFTGKVKIGQGSKQSKRAPYEFSMFDTLETIDYYSGSRYEKGEKDTDGSPKFFLNLVTFRAETASKNIDLDVKDYNFIPEDSDSVYGALLYRKSFREWAKENYYGEFINELVDDFPKYGTVVTKRVGNELMKIDLCKIRMQQDAESIEDATYFIEEHPNMTRHEMEEMPNWDLTDLKLKWNEKALVYERYGYVPLDWYKEYKGETVKKGDEDKSISVMTILAPEVESKNPDGAILFCEESDNRPYQECHYKRIAGRWLGEGEVEKNFGNQVARNMIFNLRKRGLAWSSKNVFQTMDSEVASNLVREVKDGDVLKLSQQGGVTRVDTVSRSNGDANNLDQAVEENANQRSFTFESATGEALPSGTSFRLGAMMTNTVQSYYKLKRQKLGLYLTRLAEEFLVPMFEKNNKEAGRIGITDSEDGYEILREAKKEYMKGKLILSHILNGDYEFDQQSIDDEVKELLRMTKMDFYEFDKDFWKSLKKKVTIETVGESVDVTKKMETLTTLYQTMVQSGNPASESVLKTILSLAGEKMPMTQAQSPMAQGQIGQPKSPMGQGGVPTSMGQAEQMANIQA
jgi:hypothetical protein